MTRLGAVSIVMALAISAVPAVAQQKREMAPKDMAATQIRGTVQSFSGNILDIKPPTVAPAVWVTIPAHMRVDREALKPGTHVVVEARWATVTYVALKPPHIVAALHSDMPRARQTARKGRAR